VRLEALFLITLASKHRNNCLSIVIASHDADFVILCTGTTTYNRAFPTVHIWRRKIMKQTRFSTFAWGVLLYNLGVILWGAYVRASGSGAGCGSHWPLCNGDVIPRAEYVETIVEFTHRLTSGVALLLVIGMAVWAFRAFTVGHPVRLGAIVSLVFIISEALVGAALVLFGLVGENASATRAVVIAIHLFNTFLLVAALTLTAWWASGGRPVRLRGQGLVGSLLGVAVLGALLLGITGAVTALGDTLFPVGSVAEGIQRDFSPSAHFLERLRIIHPVIAVVLGLYLVIAGGYASALRSDPITRVFAWLLAGLYAVQLGVGLLNVRLLAPIWLQLVHLLLADLVWISLILLTANALSVDETNEDVVPRLQPATGSTS
jgi:heme A synthase